MTKKIRKIHENATDLVVDQSYIDAATAALEPLKSIDQTAYDAALKYLSRRTGTKLAVTPAKFAERRIAVAQTEEPVDANDSKSVEQKREELMQKTADKQRADFEQIKKDELERKNPTNGPKIVSIWIKKLNINKSNPMNDYADIQIEWSDGKTEDTTFDISTSGKTLDTIEWNDPNDLAKSKDELEYRGKVGDGGYSIKDGLLQMDGLYRDIVRALKDSTKFGRTFVKSVYPERRDINGGMMVKKNNKYETRLDRANAVYTGGKTLKNAFQEAGVKISDEDVRVCMIKFAFSSQPDIKWFFGKDKYEDPVWAFSRVKPDPTVQKTAKSKIEKSYADKNYKGREVFKSGNTTIYKLF